MNRPAKVALGVVGGVVALNLVLSAVNKATGGTPGGPASSSYATGADGAAAYGTLLARAGHEVVRERVTPDAARVGPGDTAIVLDPPFVLRRDAESLRLFVQGGGRLVAAGDGRGWLPTVVPQAPRWSPRGIADARPLAPLPELAGVARVESAGDGSWAAAAGTLPALGDDRGSVLAVAQVGAGRVLLLADSSSLQNALLARASNARLALALAGPPSRRVVFFESYHGYGRGSGLGAIPGRWQAALLLAALAAGTFLLARWRRLGPPEADAPDRAPARLEYVDSLAATLVRTRDRRAALAPLRREVRRRLEARSGLRGDAAPAQLAAAARRLGLPDDEVDAVLAAPDQAFDELALGRALARLDPAGRRAWKS